ncbi:unnamed protein product [Didymodactylos carnosus]|uniref:Uncharacterized protein n=1 Tax=Didymodactylos carnosus TaxID=1234261 RepID=A0A815QJJ3_9BILA|nr:unnamed protein product [Didymodactylos carnosus]CAF4270262.1 unnamed protein product [Didymodactylos carnosus]CAF4334194.1 unnamed protein product [Didymodactylos carnosus]
MLSSIQSIHLDCNTRAYTVLTRSKSAKSNVGQLTHSDSFESTFNDVMKHLDEEVSNTSTGSYFDLQKYLSDQRVEEERLLQEQPAIEKERIAEQQRLEEKNRQDQRLLEENLALEERRRHKEEIRLQELRRQEEERRREEQDEQRSYEEQQFQARVRDYQEEERLVRERAEERQRAVEKSMQQAARDAKLEKGQENARESECKALECATQERILADEETEKIAKEKAKSELRTKRLRDETEAQATREREDPPAIGATIKSVRAADQFLCDGYRYRRDKSQWRWVNAHCTGRAGVTQQGFCQLASSHTHASNPEDVAKARYNHEIRERAKQSHDPPRTIISDARMNVSVKAAASIPQYTTTQRAIERTRKENDVARPTPTTFANIVLPDELKVNSHGQNSLR